MTSRGQESPTPPRVQGGGLHPRQLMTSGDSRHSGVATGADPVLNSCSWGLRVAKKVQPPARGLRVCTAMISYGIT